MNKFKLNETGEKVATSRYYQKNEKGEIIENWSDLVNRVVKHVCRNEPDEFKNKMIQIIGKTEFLPNSPCLVNAGRKTNKAGLMACYVSKAPEDTWDSMCDTIKNFGDVARAGGGCGLFLGNIRPQGDSVFGSTHAKACGPIEHMRMISEVMSSITQAGFRGMACLSSLNVSHPDIINFIKCKQKERALKSFLKEDIFHHYDKIIDNIEPQLKIVLDKFIYNFNISVLSNDKFMSAVEKDLEWELSFNNIVYNKLRAKEIFDLITENAWRNGDPGFLFEDTINKSSPYRFSGQRINSSNPCAEQVLPSSNSNCNLGSIDVSKFYKSHDVDWGKLKEVIELSFQFLDDVIDVHDFPAESFKQWGMDNRPVGLGIMGFADLLLKLKIKYGSKESIIFGEKLMKFFAETSHNKSVELAKDRGTPKCCKYKELEFRRNVTTTSIAPTGTISLLAGCSSSIEPIFSATMFRHDNTGTYEIKHPDANSEWFACALDGDGGPKEVKYEEHISIQAAFQKYCDSGISKTINMPSSATIEDVKNAYMLAWKSGCKGITIYRNNSKTTQVLNQTNRVSIKSENQKIERPQELPCDIFKIKADGHDWHIIIGIKDGNPYELFAVNGSKPLPDKGKIVKIKKKHYSLLSEDKEVLLENIIVSENKLDPKIGLETRRFSLELRHGIPTKYIVEQIDKSNELVTSFSKAAARIFKKQYLPENTFTGSLCPECLKNGIESKLIYSSGCSNCPTCFVSKCG